jgi:exosortase
MISELSHIRRRLRQTGTTEDASHRNWTPLITLTWFSLLILAAYWMVLYRLVRQWLTDDDMSHGIFVPVLAGYIVWRSWPDLTAAQPRPSAWGIVLLLAGGFLLCIGPPSLATFSILTRIAFLMTVLGSILALRGFQTLWLLRYPLVLCLLAIPVPGFVYERVTFPLQLAASWMAEHILGGMGYSVLRDGNVLHLPRQSLEVVEACSGLRSLLSLTFLGQAYVYLLDSRAWMRPVVAIAVVPIAMIANALRIVLSAWLGQENPMWLHGIFHDSTAWVVFVIAFICLVIFHKTFNLLFSR